MKAKSWYQRKLSNFSLAISYRGTVGKDTRHENQMLLSTEEKPERVLVRAPLLTPDTDWLARSDTTRHDAALQRRCYLTTVLMGKLWASRISASPYIFHAVLIAQAQRAAAFSIRRLFNYAVSAAEVNSIERQVQIPSGQRTWNVCNSWVIWVWPEGFGKLKKKKYSPNLVSNPRPSGL
jgi:hypothetical protein